MIYPRDPSLSLTIAMASRMSGDGAASDARCKTRRNFRSRFRELVSKSAAVTKQRGPGLQLARHFSRVTAGCDSLALTCSIDCLQLKHVAPSHIGTPRWGKCKAGLHERVHGTSVFDAASVRSHPTEVSV